MYIVFQSYSFEKFNFKLKKKGVILEDIILIIFLMILLVVVLLGEQRIIGL